MDGDEAREVFADACGFAPSHACGFALFVNDNKGFPMNSIAWAFDGLSGAALMSLLISALGSFSFINVFVLMNTLLQTEVPDDFRGRVLSLYSLTFFGFSPFASLAIGFIAQFTDTILAILLYGVLCLVGVILIISRARNLVKLA